MLTRLTASEVYWPCKNYRSMDASRVKLAPLFGRYGQLRDAACAGTSPTSRTRVGSRLSRSVSGGKVIVRAGAVELSEIVEPRAAHYRAPGDAHRGAPASSRPRRGGGWPRRQRIGCSIKRIRWPGTRVAALSLH